MAQKDEPLFSEDFEAWIHGPVLPSQYQRFKQSEWRPILDEISPPKLTNKDIIPHLIEVMDVFGVETASALELLTHNEQPWKTARTGIPIDQPSNIIISKESMQLFYKNLL